MSDFPIDLELPPLTCSLSQATSGFLAHFSPAAPGLGPGGVETRLSLTQTLLKQQTALKHEAIQTLGDLYHSAGQGS